MPPHRSDPIVPAHKFHRGFHRPPRRPFVAGPDGTSSLRVIRLLRFISMLHQKRVREAPSCGASYNGAMSAETAARMATFGLNPVQGHAAPWEGAHLHAATYRWGLLIVTCLGAVLRFSHIARPFNRLMAWNEGHYAMIALNFDRYGLLSQHNELGLDRTFSPGGPWLMWASMRLFGPSEAAARLPVVLAGIAAIPVIAVVALRLFRSEQIALTAASFVAVAPGL